MLTWLAKCTDIGAGLGLWFSQPESASISLHFKPGPGPGPGPGGPRPNLQVPAGQTLSFVGGDVSIEGDSNPVIPTVFATDGKYNLPASPRLAKFRSTCRT